MGWIGHIPRTEPVQLVIDELVASFACGGGEAPALYHHSEGPEWAREGVVRLQGHAEIEFVLWVLRENAEKGSRWIEVHLIDAHDDTWMVKSLDESVGPFAVPDDADAAKTLLEGVRDHPPTNKQSERYRRSLRAQAAHLIT